MVGTDYKYGFVKKVAIGNDLSGSAGTDYETIESLVRVSDRLVAPAGNMVEPLVVINTVKPVGVTHLGRLWEIEVEVDSDNPAFYAQDVVVGGSTETALADSVVNSPIAGFNYYVEESDGTDVTFDFEASRTYLTRASGRISNEPGTERNTSTYKFLCRGNRGRTEESAIASPGAVDDVQYTGVDKITVNSNDCETVLWYEWSFEGADGGDILTPRFTPNTYEAVDIVEWPGKLWRARFAIDSETDIFDSYINDDGVGTIIPAFVVTLNKAGGGTATHTYETSKSFVSRYDPYINLREGDDFNYGVIETICYGTRSVG